jgi:hypothetical protein
MTLSGLSLPFFNDAGKLTHRMFAKSGTKSGNVQRLHGVEIHYFSATQPNVIIQKIQADDATWDDKREILEGKGTIVVATEENRITGEGFDFALATSLLHVHRKFRMENDEVVLTSGRATVELIVEKGGEELKVRDVRRCEAIDNLHIVVQPTAQKRYRFKEAFSDRGEYDGAERKITLPNPTRTIQPNGGEGRIEKFTFLLEPKVKR